MAEKLWKRSIHLVATVEWAKVAFGIENVSSFYRGGEWMPGLYNPIDDHAIELRTGATRQDMLNVWSAMGGKEISDAKLNAASKAYVNDLIQKQVKK